MYLMNDNALAHLDSEEKKLTVTEP